MFRSLNVVRHVDPRKGHYTRSRGPGQREGKRNEGMNEKNRDGAKERKKPITIIKGEQETVKKISKGKDN